MKNITTYLNESIVNENNVNEGIVKNAISLALIKNIDPQNLLSGILNMYEYIVDEDDINLFYQDFPVKEQLFWKNLYQLYQKQVWSIFDTDYKEGDENIGQKLDLPMNTLTKVNVELRRDLRQLIRNSKNSKLDLKPSQPDQVLLIPDEKHNKTFFITLNRTSGIVRRLFRFADIKFLEKALEKLGVAVEKNEVKINDII